MLQVEDKILRVKDELSCHHTHIMAKIHSPPDTITGHGHRVNDPKSWFGYKAHDTSTQSSEKAFYPILLSSWKIVFVLYNRNNQQK